MGIKTNCTFYVSPEEVKGEMPDVHRCSNHHKPMKEENCPDDCEWFNPKP